MENSKVKSYFDSGIDCRITTEFTSSAKPNPAVFRAAMQLPLNRTAYSAQRGGLAFYFHPRYAGNLQKDVVEALKAKKELLMPLINSGKIKQLFPNIVINTPDDLIVQFNKREVFDAIFK